jgi:hypothetical protein
MIADVYSALLMKRVYKEAFEPGQALKIMIESNDDYDPLLFKPFVGLVVDSVKQFQNKPATPNVLAYEKESKGKIIQVAPGKTAADSLRTAQPTEAERTKDAVSASGDLNRRKGA